MKSIEWRRFGPLYLLMAPGLAWFLVYRYAPMAGIVMAFKNFNLTKGIFGSPWADPIYKHFLAFFTSPYFGQLMSNTLLISLGKMVFSIGPSLVLAILLSECRNPAFNKIVQTVTYLPHFLSWVIIYAIFYALLTQNGGLVSAWINRTTGKNIEFLADPQWFKPLLYISESWQSAGWGAVIFLAAIAGIDPQLYEAATIDGATRFQRVRHITFPAIATVFVFVLVTRVGRVMDAGFDHVFNFYNQRVYSTGDIIDTWVFRVGLEQMRYSLGSAVGLFKSTIGFVLVVATNRVARKFGRGIW